MVMTISTPDAAALTLPAALPAGRDQRVDLRLAHVEALHRVPGLEQVLRHRQTHVAEPDEADPRHALSLSAVRVSRYCLRSRRRPLCAASTGDRRFPRRSGHRNRSVDESAARPRSWRVAPWSPELFSALTISACILATMSRGVFFGTKAPTQKSKSEFGMPASIVVGTSGSADARLELDTASGSTLPARINGSAGVIGRNTCRRGRSSFRSAPPARP